MLFAQARHAVWHGARARLRAGGVVLMPAYHCGAEVEALLCAGLECRFYEATPSLAPDVGELKTLLDEEVVALYIIHTLGFPQDGAYWRHWCDANGIALIEDVAQAWLGSAGGLPLGSFGDVAIFAFHKSFGLPDGGALLVNGGNQPTVMTGKVGITTLGKRHFEWARSRTALLASIWDRLRPEVDAVTNAFDPHTLVLGDIDRGPSSSSLFLLPRVFDGDALRRRRENYKRLLAELSDLVPEPFSHLPPGACPWAFPVIVKGKVALLEHLAHRGIRAVNLWPAAHRALNVAEFHYAASLRAGIVALPVHQGLRAPDLVRIATAVAEFRALTVES